MKALPEQQPVRTINTQPALKKQRTLLIVDDDEGPRKSLQFIFKDDYQVLTTENGAQALKLIREHPVDVAILDIRMSGMSGIELLDKLKTIDPAIEVVMLTGFETAETLREALRLGACDYLNKPFDVDTLRSSVAAAMERRSLSEEIGSTSEKMALLQGELQQQAVREEIARNKGEIYASILHDINGPLTVIAGYIHIISMDLENARSLNTTQIEGVKDHLRLINRQITHCVEISQRYLGFLRRKPTDKTRLQVNTMLEDLRALLKTHPSRGAHHLDIETLPGDPVIAINGTDLIQILQNLAVNALQCTSEIHEVRIFGETVLDPIDVSSWNESRTHRVLAAESFLNTPPFVSLSVMDNGPGIAPEILGKLFQPFFTTKADKGTGLGLCIVQRLVIEAGGAIHVHSEVGRGTRFEIFLPMVRN